MFMVLCFDASPLWFYSFDLYLLFHTVTQTYSLMGPANYSNSPLQLPEVKCLASVYLSAGLSLALSLHVRL